MKKMIYIVICLLLMLNSVNALGINGDGTPVDYSKIGINARYWGMGKSGIGFVNDSGGFLLNPAGLGVVRSLEFSGMSTNLMGEFNYTLLNAVYPLENETIGLSLLSQSAGTIYGSDALDSYGHPIKGDKIENSTDMLSIGYGRKLFFNNLYIGGVIKYLQKKISFVEGRSTAVDLGAIYRWDKYLSFGVAVKNAVQSELSYDNGASEGEHIKQDYIIGVAWSLLDRRLTMALDQHSDIDFGRTNLGAEYWFSDMVALRAGVSESDMTFGVGFRYGMLQIDYALRYMEAPLENQVFVSLTYGNARHAHLDKPDIELVEEERKEIADSQQQDRANPEQIVIPESQAGSRKLQIDEGSKADDLQIQNNEKNNEKKEGVVELI